MLVDEFGETENHHRHVRWSKIHALISERHADVILLQEVMIYEYIQLQTQWSVLFDVSLLIPIEWGVGSDSGNVTLLRRSRCDHVKHHFIGFGLLTVCQIDRRDCMVYNIHLDDTDSDVRKQQLASICTESTPCILGGDFNQPCVLSSFTAHNSKPTYLTETVDHVFSQWFIAMASVFEPT